MKRSIMLAASLLALGLAHAQTTDQAGRLADKDGRTLYVFDKDAGGVSSCHDSCAVSWPPFLAKEGAKPTGTLTLHARKDGTRQWGHAGKPLYYFVGDTQAGATTGDGAGGAWHVVPAASAATAKPAKATASY